eukprot:scaffold12839_cov119-Cylindrotheca_fusiformis.AAC.7
MLATPQLLSSTWVPYSPVLPVGAAIFFLHTVLGKSKNEESSLRATDRWPSWCRNPAKDVLPSQHRLNVIATSTIGSFSAVGTICWPAHDEVFD